MHSGEGRCGAILCDAARAIGKGAMDIHCSPIEERIALVFDLARRHSEEFRPECWLPRGGGTWRPHLSDR